MIIICVAIVNIAVDVVFRDNAEVDSGLQKQLRPQRRTKHSEQGA